MKRFSVVIVLAFLAVLGICEAYATTPPETNSDNMPKHSRCTPIPVMGANVKIAPVFDATGAVVSDPSGAMLHANYSGNKAVPVMGTDVRIVTVSNVTGAVVSNPTGTMLDPDRAICASAPVTGADVKIAPVFDDTGLVVSDPTGTISRATHP